MTKFRVVKIGGSLLRLPDLNSRLARRRLQIQEADDRNRCHVFVMGGGEICNHVRQLDQRFGFSERQSHEICIELMGGTAKILQAILGLDVVDQIDELRKCDSDVIFDCRKWMSEHDDIPASWAVTSDSISAILAKEIEASLVLLKSTDNPNHQVDDYFQIASQGLTDIRIENIAD